MHTHAHTPLSGASALTCQCGGCSGPELSTRGAACGRGRSRPGWARVSGTGTGTPAAHWVARSVKGAPSVGHLTRCGLNADGPGRRLSIGQAPPPAGLAVAPAPAPPCLPAGSPLRPPRLFVCSPALPAARGHPREPRLECTANHIFRSRWRGKRGRKSPGPGPSLLRGPESRRFLQPARFRSACALCSPGAQGERGPHAIAAAQTLEGQGCGALGSAPWRALTARPR
jgi:hypothetical protein